MTSQISDVEEIRIALTRSHYDVISLDSCHLTLPGRFIAREETDYDCRLGRTRVQLRHATTLLLRHATVLLPPTKINSQETKRTTTELSVLNQCM